MPKTQYIVDAFGDRIDVEELCGWKPNPEGVEKVINDPDNLHPVFSSAGRHLINKLSGTEKDNTFLYEPLIWANKDYRRGAQGIGDCVSWGAELACTIITAILAYKARSRSRFMEAATEPIYGGSRVESRGKKLGGYSDGSYGAAAADWVKKWGVLYRKNYSGQTGNSDHDLSVYSSKKAKDWGNFGCGGQNDKDLLDKVAKEKPVQTISQIHSFEEMAAAIAIAKRPVTIASNYGSSMKRDADGFAPWSTSWAHQMCCIAVRFDKPGALCAQSWGMNVASGPKWPENMPDNIASFTWWIPASDIDKICRQGDCWAFSDIDGWKAERADWADQWRSSLAV